jgi:hypothetical protein
MLLQTLAEFDTVQEAAKGMAGNYKEWRNFAWFGEGEVPRSETIMLGYLVNNSQPSIIDLANQEVIMEALKPYLGDARKGATAEEYRASVSGDRDMLLGVMIQVYYANGHISRAFRKSFDLAKKCDASGDVLDEAVLARVNRKEMLRYLAGELPSLCEEVGITFKDNLVSQVYDDLEDNENHDYDQIDLEGIRESLLAVTGISK